MTLDNLDDKKMRAFLAGEITAEELFGDNGERPEEHHLSDLGNAKRFARQHLDGVRYCHSRRCWYIWDGRRWAADADGTIYRLAEETVRSIYEEAARAEGPEREALAKHALKSEAEARIRAMVSLAENAAGLAVTRDRFDQAAYRLNVLNGTIDLKTGELLPHKREDMITTMAPVEYDPEARYPLWGSFLERVLPDLEVRGFFKRAAGYSICGDPCEERLPFVYGPPGAGKGTILAAISGALGPDYTATADFSTFLERGRYGGGPRHDIARLAGSRMVISQEVEDGKKFAESIVCALTGGDRVAARHLYQESFEFKPEFVIWLVANHRPRVSGTDSPIWRRLLLIPFNVAIPPEERDPDVKRLLSDPEKAGPAVLAWLVEGALAWQREGLNPPAPVLALTEEYRRESDPLGDFLEERCTLGPNLRETKAAVRKAYLRWAEETGERYVLGRKQLSNALLARGMDEYRDGSAHYWIGLEVRGGELRL